MSIMTVQIVTYTRVNDNYAYADARYARVSVGCVRVFGICAHVFISRARVCGVCARINVNCARAFNVYTRADAALALVKTIYTRAKVNYSHAKLDCVLRVRIKRRAVGIIPAIMLMCASLFLSYQRHRLGARARVFAEAAAYGGGDCDCAGLLHAAYGHAGVLGLHDDHYADRLEHVVERVRDFRCQTLLNLQAPRERLNQTREFRQSDDASLLRDVCDVTFADERREVVFAERR